MLSTEGNRKRFLSWMAFSIYEVVRVACLSRGWLHGANKQTTRRADKPRERLRKR